VTGSVVLHPISAHPAEAAVVTVMQGPVGAHVGLLYQADDDGGRRYLELAWHLQMRDEEVPPPEAFWVEPRLTKHQLADIAYSALMIARRQHRGFVPYAFDPADSRFDAQGALRLNKSLGLTCATFVLRVLAHAGIQLLNEPTWNERSEMRRLEDDSAQRKLVAYLRKNPDWRSHAALVAAEVGCTRFRAEEVAAVSGMTGHPIAFERAEPAGRRVLAMLREQHAA
jgi:hypothetical protein